MSDPSDLTIYRFGGFTLDPAERTLSAGERNLTLAPKVFDTLHLLVANHGKILNKERMLKEIWEDSFVEENNLAQNISLIRKVLGETKGLRFIETVPKFGYRFVAPVESGDTATSDTEVIETTRARVYFSDAPAVAAIGYAGAALSSTTPETHYVQNGEVNVAYQILGEGPVDIVFVMGWVSHLEYFWKHHLFASFLEKLASFSRLILFDKRGTGLSDRVPVNELPTLEQRMEDVHAVMNAVGSKRALLVGVSEGGPMCSLFAATYPDLTAGLVMIGTYAKRIRDDDYPWAPTEEQREAFFEVIKREWGGPVGLDERAPSVANDPEFRQWWAEYLRMGASPGAALALTKMNAEIDVRPILPSIRVPTLVIHRKGDICLKVEEGRYVASRIPDCEYIELEGIDHLPFVGDQDEIVDEIERFANGLGTEKRFDRVLATVVNIKFDDINDSKTRPDLTASTHEFISRQLSLFKGREVAYGDGALLAVFDGPARAIRFAQSIVKSAVRSALPIKTGIHTGECDVIDETYSGFAVELTQRIADESSKNNILVSRTVKDLVAGSGLQFDEAGIRSFENIAGEWRLFTVNS
jgi:pimeloyl-ACP methyl ester carboxylesterase/DNA-binding winged helix-turn-helix (wHTH) protein/class 3 adenylate cyclase